MRVAVIGGGVIGLAASRRLMSKGHDVSCFDAAPGGGASSGRGRIFRYAHAYPNLVDLALQARAYWDEWEDHSGQVLIEPTGFLLAGDETADLYEQAMNDVGVAVSRGDSRWGRQQLPWLQLDENCLADPAGGSVNAAETMRWLLAQTAPVLTHEHADTLIMAMDGSVRVNDLPFDRVLVCAGPATSRIAGRIGLELPDHQSRHVRFSFQVPEGVWPSHMNRAEKAGAHGAYGVQVDKDTYAVGVNWPDPTAGAHYDLENALRYHAGEFAKYSSVFLPDIVLTGEYVQCRNNHWPFPPGRQFAVWQYETVTVFGGNDLFKFAPLLGRQLADIATGGAVPEHLTAEFEWPDVHPAHGVPVRLALPTN